MNNPGVYNLGSQPITGAITDLVITDGSLDNEFIEKLDGMISCTLSANFVYGSGGTNVLVRVETSLNQGFTWIEVARWIFTTTGVEKLFNLVANSERLTPYSPAPLSNDTAISGIFGDRWRAKITTTGTYGGNTSISVRMNAR